MSYIARRRMWKAEKEQRKEKWLEERLRRRQTEIQMAEDCSDSHLHLPKYIKSITNGSAPPIEALPDPGVFEKKQQAVNFQAGV